MKKALSVFLILALALLSACASADTLVIRTGAPSAASMGSFKAFFDYIASSVEYSVVWEDTPVSENGYEVYTAHANGTALSIKVYVSGGAVSHIIVQSDGYAVNSTYDAGMLGQWFGKTLYTAVASLYFGESTNPGIQLPAALSAGVDRAMETLMACLGDNRIMNGIVTAMNILDYPVGLEITATGSSIPAALNMKFAVAGKSSRLESSAAQVLTGWQQVGGVWKWYSANGEMAVGWKEINGSWYWFAGDGSMATGWQKIKDIWYYFDDDGRMATGWKQVENEWYYFGNDGIMATGWIQYENEWYHLRDDGPMTVGWLEQDGSKFCFDGNGCMVTGWREIEGAWYYFHGNGTLYATLDTLVPASSALGASCSFPAPITQSMEFEPAAVRSADGAARFSESLLVDYSVSKDGKSAEGMVFDPGQTQYPSFAGTDGSSLNLMLVSESDNAAFLLFYKINTDAAFGFYIDGIDPRAAETLFAGLCPDGYLLNAPGGV